MTQHTGERRVYVVRSGPERPIAIHLLTYLFLGMSALYVLLTSVFRPFWLPLSPRESAYVPHLEGPALWFYHILWHPYVERPILWFCYILWHPYVAILCSAFITVAAVQFYRRRDWGRAALGMASRLVLLVIPVAFLGLVLWARGQNNLGPGMAVIGSFAAGPIICVMCLPMIRVLRSPKVRAAMVDRPRHG